MTTANYPSNYKKEEEKYFKKSGRAGKDVIKSNKKNTPQKTGNGTGKTNSEKAAGLAQVASSLAGMRKDSMSGFEGSTTDINAFHPETTESGSVNDNDDKNYYA